MTTPAGVIDTPFVRRAIVVALSVYSATLLGLELATSQDFVRHFFSDIDGPMPFFAVNTTLSVSLLWGAALLAGVAASSVTGLTGTDRFRTFCISQVLVLGILGFDDRFKFHEWAGWKLGVPDHFILMTTALVECACVIGLAGPALFRSRAGRHLVVAIGVALVMLGIDALAPERAVLRLSLEDLAKTWSAFFFLLFGWELFQTALQRVRVGAASVRPRDGLDEWGTACWWPLRPTEARPSSVVE